MARNFRTVFRHLVPSWLSEGEGGAVLYTLSAMADVFVQRGRDALEQRFPSRAGADALAEIGKDRGIFRGRTETSEHYAARLQGWRWPRGHRTRGNAFALLEQIAEYFGSALIWSIDVAGNRYERSTDEIETTVSGESWDWDSEAPVPYTGRAKFWLVLKGSTVGASAHAGLGDPECWGGALGNRDTTLGMNGMAPGDVKAIQRLFRRPAWHPGGTYPQMMIVQLPEAGGEPVPDGHWYRWLKIDSGAGVRARAEGFRFFSLLT